MTDSQSKRNIERVEQWYRTLSSDGRLPVDWTAYVTGDLALAFEQAGAGISLRSVYDLRMGCELLARNPAPLFVITLFNGEGDVPLDAATGWGQTELRRIAGGFLLRWSEPLDERAGPLQVRLQAHLQPKHHAVDWTMVVTNTGSPYSVRRVTFPQVELNRFDDDPVVFFPSGPGELKHGAWDEVWRYDQPYGQAWCSMQYMAAYAAGHGASGLYVGVHDPFAGTKDLRAFSDPARHTVTLHYDIPAPDQLRPGNGFRFSGEARWQLLHGDWFDAAQIYKRWCHEHARWWLATPREDIPQWMRTVGVWLQENYEPTTSVQAILRFQEYMGVSVAVHWYNWHQIPFDNDYPHYFPAKHGFADVLRELRRKHVTGMPYINGRLWDTHDRGAEDFEFTRVALPAATKDMDGNPIVERYGSIETDGSPVTLAVMCPTTELWQERVREITLKLINDIGADGVYIDQVAAAKPVLCVDPTHSHPAGGGHWWNEGYWDMLDRIRQSLPPGRMLTTECNAEAFIRQFDGYLTWHWQHDNMVPAFQAIYGGAILIFGRAYNGDATAQRMKAGQQFVFGEQIGWFAPRIIDQPDVALFLRSIIHLRQSLVRYFYAGEMLRPPVLDVPVSRVRADWQWYGENWVTTDAVMCGAWALLNEHRMVLLFANVGDIEVRTVLQFNCRDYGITFKAAQLSIHDPEVDATPPEAVGARFQRAMAFAPRSAIAIELVW